MNLDHQDQSALKMLKMSVIFLVLSIAAVVIKPASQAPAQEGVEISKYMYTVRTEHLSDGLELRSTFVASSRDVATVNFLNECKAASANWTGRIILRSRHQAFLVLQRVLGWSQTDAMVFLGHATMFAASQDQLGNLIRSRQWPIRQYTTMLDVGAGSGSVTQTVASAFKIPASNVKALEVSLPLRRALTRRGFQAIGSFNELDMPDFDVVALLHVLDRCDQPADLLQQTAHRVAVGGSLLIASPLPFCAKVWTGSFGSVMVSRAPRRPLLFSSAASCDSKSSFETSASAFAAEVLQPLRDIGFVLLAWTRVPYLSSAVTQTHHALDSALFVLRRVHTDK